MDYWIVFMTVDVLNISYKEDNCHYNVTELNYLPYKSSANRSSGHAINQE